jgi:hypothetical protein
MHRSWELNGHFTEPVWTCSSAHELFSSQRVPRLEKQNHQPGNRSCHG